MTYAQFLVVFLVPPILALGFLVRRRWRLRHTGACALVCLLGFLYPSPWNNHAAAVRRWTVDPHFAPPSHLLGHLPWEEYAFYGLQGVLMCLLIRALTRPTESL